MVVDGGHLRSQPRKFRSAQASQPGMVQVGDVYAGNRELLQPAGKQEEFITELERSTNYKLSLLNSAVFIVYGRDLGLLDTLQGKVTGQMEGSGAGTRYTEMEKAALCHPS